MAQSPTGIAAVVLSFDPASGFLLDFIEAVTDTLSREGLFTSIHNSGWDCGRERGILQRLARDRIDGILLLPVSDRHNVEILCEIAAQGPRLALVDACTRNLPAAGFASDNIGGARDLTRLLIERGHDRIGFLSCSPINGRTSLQDRYFGYCQAVREHGMMPLPFFPDEEGEAEISDACGRPGCRSVPGNRHILSLRSRIPAMIGNGITAVFAEQDSLALDVMEACRDLGIDIPRDLSLAGFDDIPALDRLTIPLTTVHQSFDLLGQESAAWLADTIRLGLGAAGPGKRLPVRIVDRGSVRSRTRSGGWMRSGAAVAPGP